MTKMFQILLKNKRYARKHIPFLTILVISKSEVAQWKLLENIIGKNRYRKI